MPVYTNLIYEGLLTVASGLSAIDPAVMEVASPRLSVAASASKPAAYSEANGSSMHALSTADLRPTFPLSHDAALDRIPLAFSSPASRGGVNRAGGGGRGDDRHVHVAATKTVKVTPPSTAYASPVAEEVVFAGPAAYHKRRADQDSDEIVMPMLPPPVRIYCPKCNKAFIRTGYLQRHLRIHHSNAPPKQPTTHTSVPPAVPVEAAAMTAMLAMPAMPTVPLVASASATLPADATLVHQHAPIALPGQAAATTAAPAPVPHSKHVSTAEGGFNAPIPMMPSPAATPTVTLSPAIAAFNAANNTALPMQLQEPATAVYTLPRPAVTGSAAPIVPSRQMHERIDPLMGLGETPAGNFFTQVQVTRYIPTVNVPIQASNVVSVNGVSDSNSNTSLTKMPAALAPIPEPATAPGSTATAAAAAAAAATATATAAATPVAAGINQMSRATTMAGPAAAADNNLNVGNSILAPPMLTMSSALLVPSPSPSPSQMRNATTRTSTTGEAGGNAAASTVGPNHAVDDEDGEGRPGHDGQKVHICPSCNKKFGQMGNLNRHMLVHTNEKPYVCNTCGKGFSQKSHLKTHMVCHTGAKPFQCINCDKRFTQHGHLKQHLANHEKALVESRALRCYLQGCATKSWLNRSDYQLHMEEVHSAAVEQPGRASNVGGSGGSGAGGGGSVSGGGSVGKSMEVEVELEVGV